jgi:hypothetical protein
MGVISYELLNYFYFIFLSGTIILLFFNILAFTNAKGLKMQNNNINKFLLLINLIIYSFICYFFYSKIKNIIEENNRNKNKNKKTLLEMPSIRQV